MRGGARTPYTFRLADRERNAYAAPAGGLPVSPEV